MTAYRDPIPDPFMQAVADALSASAARERAREAKWQAGRAEALRAIDAFDAAVAPARLRIEHERTIDDLRTNRTTVYLTRGEHQHALAWVAWRDGWVHHTGEPTETFETILLNATREPDFADALAKMQREDFADLVAPPTPDVASSRWSTVAHVVRSLVLALLLCGACLALVVILRHIFPTLFG